jgi:hypothetical protein
MSMRTRNNTFKMVRGRVLRLVLAVAMSLALLCISRMANAQGSVGPELGRSGAVFFADGCGLGSCNVKICGHSVQFVPQGTGGLITVPDLGVQNVFVSLTPGQGGNNAIAVANALNVYCGSTAGDGLLATGGSLHMQSAQVASLSRSMNGNGAASGSIYGGGGVGEISSTTYGASIPLDYGYRISHDAAVSTVGFVNFAHESNANQVGGSTSTAYAWEIKNQEGKRIIGVAGYVPLSFAAAKVENVPDGSIISWGAGGGALALGSFHFRVMDISYGAGVAFRGTSSGVALPMSALIRAEQPLDFLFHMFSTYTALSYGTDFLNAGSASWSLALGGAYGKYEFGYRGFYSNSYVAHTLGFTIRKDLPGSEIFERNIPEEQKQPGPRVTPPPTTPGAPGPTTPTAPGPTTPSAPLETPEGPPVSLPPRPELPTLPPECQSDMDCPGDNVCEEGQCIPPP